MNSKGWPAPHRIHKTSQELDEHVIASGRRKGSSYAIFRIATDYAHRLPA
ncbi:MAG: hypothetical protein QHJ34_14980 [bacterium]|jgi:hypothetical protein|nr:hypothetical protein [candidate division KSB1 bacterium]MDH7561506.1 hypothetical protein [bacterium]